MEEPTLLQRHPALRWFAPLLLVAAAGVSVGLVLTGGSAARGLPATDAAHLIDEMHASATDTDAMSGTVVSRVSLGLPDLAVAGLRDSIDSTSPLSLLNGTHSLEVWYGGPTQQRIDVLGSTAETDYFRDGSNAWQWNSSEREAVRLPAVPDAITPAGLAHRALSAVRSTTAVSVVAGNRVAGRSTYEMVLRPRVPGSSVGAVHIAVDGATKMPLAVQVFARGARTPAVDVAFTSVAFAAQPARNFSFRPPSGSAVRDASTWGARADVVGTGWTSVLRISLPVTTASSLTTAADLAGLPTVSGVWGSGRVLHTSFVSALLVHRGVGWSMYAGAVDEQQLLADVASTR